jgi:hypothetical protein
MTDNERRAEYAFRIVLHYQQLRGDQDDMEGSIVDLMTDLLHLSDQYGTDIDYLQRVARDNYDSERDVIIAR